MKKFLLQMKNHRLNYFSPFICGGGVLLLLFFSLFVSELIYAAFVWSLMSIIWIVFTSESEKEIISFYLFLFLYARIFKSGTDSTSLFTYLEFVMILLVVLRFYKKKDIFNKTIYIIFALVSVNVVLQLLTLNWANNAIIILKLVKNFVVFYLFAKSYKKENTSYLCGAFIAGFIVSIFFGFFKLAIPRLFELTGDINTVWVNGVEYYRFSGLDPDPNYFSVPLLMCYALAFIMMSNRKSKCKLLWGTFALLLIICGLFTYSKSFYLMVALETVVLVLCKNNRKIGVKPIIVTVGLLAVLIGLVLLNPFNIFEPILTRFTEGNLTTGRTEIWQMYFEQIFSSPKNFFIGAGLDAKIINNKYAHNMYIEALYNMGFLGTMMFMATYIYMIVINRRRINRGVINYIGFAAILIQYFFLNGFMAYEMPYYLMSAYVLFNTNISQDECIVKDVPLNIDDKVKIVLKGGYMKFKKFFATNKLTQKLYAKLCLLKDKSIKRKKLNNMQKNGIQTIHFLQTVLSNANVNFFFDMGTLLGIIREGRLLGHDIDIDVAVVSEDEKTIEKLNQKLIENGCRHAFRYTIDDIGIFEDSYTINGIKFDVNYYRNEGNKDVCYLGYQNPEHEIVEGLMDVVKLSCRHIEKIEQMNFAGGIVNVPEKAEEYLAQRYGEHWRVPDKNYIYWKGPSASPIENKSRRVIF